MHYFYYRKNELYCEQARVEDIACRYGTPLYIYSKKTLLDQFLKIKKAFLTVKPLICYSVKANSNLSLLKILVKQGAGLDIVSGGELFRAGKVRCPANRVVYASVGKTDIEILDAIKYGILMFNVESVPELDRINKIAASVGKKVKAALRVNPDVDPHTHAYITTGKKETKFGIDIATAENVFVNKKQYPFCTVCGVHIHIGSQITEAAPFVKAIKKISVLIKKLRFRGAVIEYLNIGGGLGIVYDKEKPQTAAAFAGKIVPLLKKLEVKVILEPGRFIVGNAGILVAGVTYVKETAQKKFVIVDAGMNDLMRPSLYNAYHSIQPVSLLQQEKSVRKTVDIVGPICESGDFLGKDRHLTVSRGDHIAVFGAGAYGFSMSSQYNSRPRAAEVLVDGKKVSLIRKRESYKDLIVREIIV